MQFAIMDIPKGVRQDMTTIKLAKAFSPESENVYLTKGKAKRMRGRVKEFTDGSGVLVAAPDGNIIIRYHLHNDVRNNIEYIFALTKKNIYRWLPSSNAYSTTYYTSPTDVTLWDTVSWDDKIIATSDKDFVQVWSDGGAGGSADTVFAPLDTASGLDLDGGVTFLTRAKYVTVYENFLFLAHTTEGGTLFKERRRHSSQGDPTDFDETGSGNTGAKDFIGRGEIKGFGIYTSNAANLLITFMKDGSTGSIQTSWLTEDDLVFENNEINNTIGLLATHSVVNDKVGNVYYFATDYTIRKLFDPNILSDAIEDIAKQINLTLQDDIEATYIDEFNWLAWSLPESDSSTGNDRVVYFDINESRKNRISIWYRGSWAVRAFGSWTRQATLTIDGLDDLYATIDSIGLESIDSTSARAGFPFDLASDYSGNTFSLHQGQQDNDSDFIGTLVLVTDLSDKGTPTIHKRIVDGITYIYNAEPTDDLTVIHSYKEDDDANWQGSDSINLEGDGEFIYGFIPYDLRSRLFKLRLQGSNRFEFNGLVVEDYIFDGRQ